MPEISAPPRLGIIIVSYNSAGVLPDCVAALRAAVATANGTIAPEPRLVVVDNASTIRPDIRDTPELRVTPLFLDENLGFSPAVNRALQVIPEADLILLLNPDARLQVDALRELIAPWRGSSPPAVTGPVLVDELDQPHGYSERPFHTVRREIARQFAPFLLDRMHWGHRAGTTGDARCLTGACLLVDGHFLREVGGLDAYIQMYLEDVELCWQAHARGRGVQLVRSARCGHALGGSSEGDNFMASIDLHLMLLAARVEFIRRHGGAAQALATRAVIAIGSAGRVMVATVARRPQLRRRHLETLRWAVASGAPPSWPPTR